MIGSSAEYDDGKYSSNRSPPSLRCCCSVWFVVGFSVLSAAAAGRAAFDLRSWIIRNSKAPVRLWASESSLSLIYVASAALDFLGERTSGRHLRICRRLCLQLISCLVKSLSSVKFLLVERWFIIAALVFPAKNQSLSRRPRRKSPPFLRWLPPWTAPRLRGQKRERIVVVGSSIRLAGFNERDGSSTTFLH